MPRPGLLVVEEWVGGWVDGWMGGWVATRLAGGEGDTGEHSLDGGLGDVDELDGVGPGRDARRDVDAHAALRPWLLRGRSLPFPLTRPPCAAGYLSTLV